MSDHFVMVWSDMLGSSINDQEVHVRWCFLVMLLLSDKNGDFRATTGFLSRMAVIPEDQAREALEILSSPDENSSSAEEGGRRIISRGPNDWHIVNYESYRQRYLEEKKRAQAKERMRRLRGGDEQSVTEANSSEPSVTERTERNPVDVDVDVDVDVSPKKRPQRFIVPSVEEVQAYIDEKGLLVDARGFIDFYESKGWMVGKNKMKVWRSSCNRAQDWETNQKKYARLVKKEEKPLGEFGKAAKAKSDRLMARRAEIAAAAQAADEEA